APARAAQARRIAASDPGCLVILSDRLRESPGVVAIEADFRDHTLTVRYQPTRMGPDQLNALADEVGALFAQRVTYCERREGLGACAECDLRLGNISRADGAEFSITAQHGRVGLSRCRVPIDTAELVRPLARSKPWGAPFSLDEMEQHARGRAMALLTGVCLGMLLLGMLLERSGAPAIWRQSTLVLSALAG